MVIVLSKAVEIKHFEYTTNEGDGSNVLLQLIQEFVDDWESTRHPPSGLRFEMSPVISTILSNNNIHYQATVVVYDS